MAKKYYDDEERTEEDYQPAFKDLPKEPLRRSDWLLAFVVAVLAAAFLSVFPFPFLAPETWGDAAVAAALRPPETIFPSFHHVIARAFFRFGGMEGGLLAMRLTGRLLAALSCAMVFLFLRSVFSMLMRSRLRYAPLRYFTMRMASLVGAMLYICADPVWRAGQTFSSSGVLMLLTTATMYWFASFLLNGRMRSVYLAMFAVGLLSSETTFGFLLLVLCWAAYHLALARAAVSLDFPMLNPVVSSSAKWRVTFLYVAGLMVGIAVNCVFFTMSGGLAACGAGPGDMPLMYVATWWNLISSNFTFGLVPAFIVALLPCVLTAVQLGRAIDDEQFLPYHIGALFLISALVCYSQFSMLPPLWFWNWSDLTQIASPFLLQTVMLAAACAVAFGIAVFGCDMLCRNVRRLAQQRFAELHTDEGAEATTIAYERRGRRGARFAFVVIVVLVALGVLPARRLERTRAMLGLIEDYAREVIEECGPVKWIFTDGSFDPRLEIEAARRGKTLYALSMMAGNAPYQQFLRLRGSSDLEDRTALAMGAPMALRTWMRDKPARMEMAAIQLGFELWDRDGKQTPSCSGVLSRPMGMPEEERLEGVKRCNLLADRVLSFYADGGPSKMAGRFVKELFLFVQWRISRLARMRAKRADFAGDTALAIRDKELSDKLDDSNESLQTILKMVEKARQTALKQVTPREGLQLALARADFGMAERYARSVLDSDPDDPAANFGTGMCYFMQKQYSRAEEYIRRVLVKKPREAAAWNNLAMIYLYTDRSEEGLVHAKKALEIVPESTAVMDTIRKLEEAIRVKKEGKNKPASK